MATTSMKIHQPLKPSVQRTWKYANDEGQERSELLTKRWLISKCECQRFAEAVEKHPSRHDDHKRRKYKPCHGKACSDLRTQRIVTFRVETTATY